MSRQVFRWSGGASYRPKRNSPALVPCEVKKAANTAAQKTKAVKTTKKAKPGFSTSPGRRQQSTAPTLASKAVGGFGCALDVGLDDDCGVCEAQILDMTDELLELLLAPDFTGPRVNALDLRQRAEVLLSQEVE